MTIKDIVIDWLLNWFPAEDESAEICEVCGNAGKLRGKSWYYVSCEEHKR